MHQQHNSWGRVIHTLTFLVCVVGAAALPGCSSSAGTGALAGGGVGALMGQAIGGNTTGTLIGAAVGTGAGYMIGNEMDRSQARQEQQRRDQAQAQREREQQQAMRDLQARQAALEAQGNAPTTGTFIPPAWPGSTQQMQPLADTSWRVTSMTPPPRRQFASMTLHFQPNGHVITTTEFADGTMRVDSETYRVVGNTLIINGSDYLTNSTWTMSGNQLTLVNQTFRTSMERVGDGD